MFDLIHLFNNRDCHDFWLLKTKRFGIIHIPLPVPYGMFTGMGGDAMGLNHS